MPTRATLMNRLIAEGTVERIRVNRYAVHNTVRTRSLGLSPVSSATGSEVVNWFLTQNGTQETDWAFRIPRPRTQNTAESFAERVSETPVLRRITRDSYHGNGSGTERRGIEEAIRAVAYDSDGIRRTFGLEWEIYSLTDRQEDKLARLLDTMPRHFTERDGSLSSSGVEIIFLPVGADEIVEIFNTLKQFCIDNNVSMNGTGAHITYGVSRAEVSVYDLQIRLNRIALSVKAASTQQAIRDVFGRDFTGYASLPNSTTVHQHSNAWNASRGDHAYELRLCNWQGNIEKIVAFMKATEFIFTRTFTAQDFINIFTIMGSNVQGA